MRRELRAAGGFLEHEFPGQNIWLVAERHYEDERIARAFDRDVKNRFGQLQLRDGYPRWHFEVLEGACGVHGNVIGPLSPRRAEQLLEYTFEGLLYGDFIQVQPIAEIRGGMRGLIGHGLKNPGYLGKELGRKHPLGAGGGDKIRYSESLRDELLGRGMIEERKRTYASRSLRKRAPAPSKVVAPGETQLSLFPHLAKPVARLGEFAGGIAPPTVAAEIEFLRRRRGLTQAQLASRAGISRPQLTNFIQGRFGTSEWHVQRLREALTA